LPPPKRVEMGAFYQGLRPMEFSAEFGYTTRQALLESFPFLSACDPPIPLYGKQGDPLNLLHVLLLFVIRPREQPQQP
jgi:hypothetical protein